MGSQGAPPGLRERRYRCFTQKEDAMNAQQLKGRWTHFKDDLKQQWGKFTPDDLKQIEGSYKEFVGKVQERYA